MRKTRKTADGKGQSNRKQLRALSKRGRNRAEEAEHRGKKNFLQKWPVQRENRGGWSKNHDQQGR